MTRGKTPLVAAAAASNAEIAAYMSKLPCAGFVDGTSGAEKGPRDAKGWTERAKFDEGAKKMQAELAKLSLSTQTVNPNPLKTAFGAAAGACEYCHDNFRNPSSGPLDWRRGARSCGLFFVNPGLRPALQSRGRPCGSWLISSQSW